MGGEAAQEGHHLDLSNRSEPDQRHGNRGGLGRGVRKGDGARLMKYYTHEIVQEWGAHLARLQNIRV